MKERDKNYLICLITLIILYSVSIIMDSVQLIICNSTIVIMYFLNERLK